MNITPLRRKILEEVEKGDCFLYSFFGKERTAFTKLNDAQLIVEYINYYRLPRFKLTATGQVALDKCREKD